MRLTHLLFFLGAAAFASAAKRIPRDVPVVIREAYECDDQHKLKALALFRANVLNFLPEAKDLRAEVIACKAQMHLGEKKVYIATIDIDGDKCNFNFDVDYTKESKNDKVLKKSIEALQQQALACKITPPNPDAKHPGITEEGREACDAEASETALRNFVDYIDLPTVDYDYFTVLECWKQATGLGAIATISLKDKKGKGVLASMYFPRHVSNPDVLTKPENYVKALTYAYEHPKHPGLVKGDKIPCKASMRGHFLEDFVNYVGAASLKPSDLTLLSCTVQTHKGTIVNMDIIDDAGLSAFVSMYYLPYSGVSDVISDVPGLIEEMRKLDNEEEIVETTYEHYEEYEETISYTEFFAAHNREKKTLCGGWQDLSETECRKFVDALEKTIGVEKGYFSGLQLSECKSQALQDLNAQFKLSGDSNKLLGHDEVKFHGFISLDKKIEPIFSSAPEDFIEKLQESKGIFQACSSEDKKKFARGFKSVAGALTLNDQVLFTENIKSCLKSGKKMNLEVSFNGHPCAIFANNSGEGYQIADTTCPLKEVML